MKFKDYVAHVNELLADRPESGELEVITARDDEGNGYNKVHYSPSIGNLSRNEWYPENVDDPSGEENNAVLLN